MPGSDGQITVASREMTRRERSMGNRWVANAWVAGDRRRFQGLGLTRAAAEKKAIKQAKDALKKAGTSRTRQV